MKKSLLFSILSLFLFNISFTQESENDEVVIKTVDKEKFKSALESKEYILFDVRTIEEYKEGHIDGAKNLDVLDEVFDKTIKNISTSNKHLIYCKSGARSSQALNKMQDAGFTHVLELEGGYENWTK